MGKVVVKAEAKGSVYSVRFSSGEVELLKSLASRDGKKISDVIREGIQVMASPRSNAVPVTTYWVGRTRMTVTPTAPPTSGTATIVP